jgi:hypothetical protein
MRRGSTPAKACAAELGTTCSRTDNRLRCLAEPPSVGRYVHAVAVEPQFYGALL